MSRRVMAPMQPYLFPYLGYFQLIAAADVCVVADDFPWRKGGWINHNRVLGYHGTMGFTLPVARAGHGVAIGERMLTPDFARQRVRLLRRIRDGYVRAPHRDEVIDLMERALPAGAGPRLGPVLAFQLEVFCEHLGISTPLVLSSTLGPTRGATRSEAPIAMARAIGATTFLNAIAGGHLYDPEALGAAGLGFELLDHVPLSYPQGHHPGFVPRLSIIDVLMWNDRATVATLLASYRTTVVVPERVTV